MIKLFFALEVREEYDARIRTLTACLPESDRGGYHGDDSEERVVPEIDVEALRKELVRLESARRKLNDLIQRANFDTEVRVPRLSGEGDEVMTLNGALSYRKDILEKVGNLAKRVRAASKQVVVFKEGRDIVRQTPDDFMQCFAELERTRSVFRDVTLAIRMAGYEKTISFVPDELTGECPFDAVVGERPGTVEDGGPFMGALMGDGI